MQHHPGLSQVYYHTRAPFYAHRRRALRKILREEFDIQAPVKFIDHHCCHATSPYYSSSFGDALVVSIDGGGGGLSSRVYSVRDGVFSMLHEVPTYDSLGDFYAYVSEVCGFKAARHEGKVTGQAAHGKPQYLDQLGGLMAYRDSTFDPIPENWTTW